MSFMVQHTYSLALGVGQGQCLAPSLRLILVVKQSIKLEHISKHSLLGLFYFEF